MQHIIITVTTNQLGSSAWIICQTRARALPLS
jgi:hypothetical protein